MPPDDHGLDQIASAEDPRERQCLALDALVRQDAQDEAGLEQEQSSPGAAERARSVGAVGTSCATAHSSGA